MASAAASAAVRSALAPKCTSRLEPDAKFRMAIGRRHPCSTGLVEAPVTGSALRLAQAVEFVLCRQWQRDEDMRGVGLIRERDLDPAVQRNRVEVVGFIEHEFFGGERPMKLNGAGGPFDRELRRGRTQAGEDVSGTGGGRAVVVLIRRSQV